MEILGIDIGGSGIKGAPVDTVKGVFLEERYRIPTPQPAKPEAVGDVVAEITQYFNWNGPIGCTFPAIIKRGVTLSAANVDDSWVGTDAQRLLQRKTGNPVVILNDADAAGIAEMEFGVGKGRDGIVFMLTLGTGIGSAIFVNGELMPNTELGHIKIRGKDAEHRASDKVRQDKDLSWKKWSKRLNELLQHLDFLFSPDLFVLGGGVSKKHHKFLHHLKTNADIVPANLRNDAGIIGAALAAKKLV